MNNDQRMPVPDERLSCALSFFPKCDWGADIGADHGILSLALLRDHICEHMIVSDISANSLEKAQRLLELHGYADRACFRVGDGLTVLDDRVESAAILGMGGKTVSGILLNGKEHLGKCSLILSAHTDLPLLRKTVSEIGYHLSGEKVVEAAGRRYVIMKAENGRAKYSEKQLIIGPCLMNDVSAAYENYLRWRIGVVQCMRSSDAGQIMKYLEEELQRVRYSRKD